MFPKATLELKGVLDHSGSLSADRDKRERERERGFRVKGLGFRFLSF